MNVKELYEEVEKQVVASVTSELQDAGLKPEVEFSPVMRGCIATLSTGEQIYIPVAVLVKRNGSYTINYQIPPLTFLPKYEVFYQGKKHTANASDPYHAALLVLKRLGSKFPETEAKSVSRLATPVDEEEEEEIVVVDEPCEVERENTLARSLADSTSKDNYEIAETLLGIGDEQVVVRILQNELDRLDIPAVVVLVQLDGDEGVYCVESMSPDIEYQATLPVRILSRRNGIVYKIAGLLKPVKSAFGVRIYEVKLPSGETVTVETADEEKVIPAVEDYWIGVKDTLVSGNNTTASKQGFEIVSVQEIAANDFSEDALLNPWATVMSGEGKFLVEL